LTNLDASLAGTLARVALANVVREYPRKLDHLLHGPPGDLTPRRVHPAFYGSFDWHSAVHMHWLLARVLGGHPGLPEADRIAAVLDDHLNERGIARELAYLQDPSGKTFERPYGWAWLLEMQAELLRLGNPRWAGALAPLASLIAQRFAGFLAAAPYPMRAGSHGNSAFACILALDFSRVAGRKDLETQIVQTAGRWYGNDRDAPLAYEPSLDDFLSPALVEALLMKAVMEAGEFRRWVEGFLPAGFGALAVPPRPTDRSDPKQSHLDGLALSRAWCFRRLGHAEFAETHLAQGLPHVAGSDYVGEHWLASFAALALGDRP
jgi:hypothetical protein